MKMNLYITASKPCHGDIQGDAEKIFKVLKIFVSKTLRLKRRVSEGGSGAGFGRRDVSAIVPIKESELTTILNRIPQKKNIFLDGVKIELEYLRLNIESRRDKKGHKVGLDASFKPDFNVYPTWVSE